MLDGKIAHDSVGAAVDVAISETTEHECSDHDCSEIRFETAEHAFTVQSLAECSGVVHNVTGLSQAGRDRVARELDLDVDDEGHNYLVLESEAETPIDVLDELKSIADVVDAGLGDAAEAKTFTVAKPTAWHNLKSIVSSTIRRIA